MLLRTKEREKSTGSADCALEPAVLGSADLDLVVCDSSSRITRASRRREDYVSATARPIPPGFGQHNFAYGVCLA
jgi:hypothetical protein